MINNKMKWNLLLLMVTLSLTGCGGGDSSPADTSTDSSESALTESSEDENAVSVVDPNEDGNSDTTSDVADSDNSDTVLFVPSEEESVDQTDNESNEGSHSGSAEEEATEVVVTEPVEEESSETVVTEPVEEETTETVVTQPVEEETTETVVTQPVEEESTETVVTEPVEEETTEAVVTEPVEEDTTEAVVTEPVEEETTEAVVTEPVEEETTETVVTEPVEEETTETVVTEPVEEETTETVVTEPVEEETTEAVVTEPVVEESTETVVIEPVEEETTETVVTEPVEEEVTEPVEEAMPYSDANAFWLAGSWGITQRVDGGYKLDASADSSDWQAGAHEIVANTPEAGHVITSFTHPAHAYLFTLRSNNNIDVAAIHPDMVPTLENEQIILDVIDIYRAAGKKVILYLNAAGPSMAAERNDPEIQEAWEAYYASEWAGDEAAAWRHLVLGYAQRFNGLIDGYWLDNATNLPGDLSDFVEMLRSVDPTLAIAVNKSKAYFTDAEGEFLYVDTDGLDDEDETDYKIVKHAPLNEYGDFTAGHVTPLGRGAPPNSWGYDEYTLPDMAATPWQSYDGSRDTLKHAWFPIRDSWSGSNAELMFEVEQAYRFVRTVTDGGAAMTWSTTQKRGYMPDDEMEIMVEINQRMAQSPKADYQSYERPEGAYLLSESN